MSWRTEWPIDFGLSFLFFWNNDSRHFRGHENLYVLLNDMWCPFQMLSCFYSFPCHRLLSDHISSEALHIIKFSIFVGFLAFSLSLLNRLSANHPAFCLIKQHAAASTERFSPWIEAEVSVVSFLSPHHPKRARGCLVAFQTSLLRAKDCHSRFALAFVHHQSAKRSTWGRGSAREIIVDIFWIYRFTSIVYMEVLSWSYKGMFGHKAQGQRFWAVLIGTQTSTVCTLIWCWGQKRLYFGVK